MPISRVLPTVLFLLLLPLSVSAADVAVFPPEISNLSPQDTGAVGELVAQAYASVSQQSVVSPSYAQPTLAEAKTYPAAAAQLGVREYIRLSAVAAGKRLVITAARYQADGQLLHQYRHSADGIEGAAFASETIARALLTGTPQSETAPPAGAPVIAPELPPLKMKPKKDEMVYGVKTGVHLPFAKGASYYAAVSLQFNGRLQLPRFFLEFGAGFLIPTVIDDGDDYEPCIYNSATLMSECPEPAPSRRGHVGGITTELGASYYLTQTNVAPYIGGGIIPRVVLAGLDQGEKEDIASMSGYVQFGLTFPRDRPTRFFFDLRLAQALLPQHLESGSRVWPTEPSLHAGLGW